VPHRRVFITRCNDLCISTQSYAWSAQHCTSALGGMDFLVGQCFSRDACISATGSQVISCRNNDRKWNRKCEKPHVMCLTVGRIVINDGGFRNVAVCVIPVRRLLATCVYL